MDCKCNDEALGLAWSWAIEALLTFTQISDFTLQALIDAAPVRHEKFSETTRELIALRCLEILYSEAGDHGASSALDSGTGFDFPPSCQEVLTEALYEIRLSDPQMVRAKRFAWDMYPFIEHKRAVTFKCHLDQLRESILEGTHPHADLLREISGLLPQNEMVNNGKHDDHSHKDVGNSNNAENMGEKEDPVILISENGNKSSKELLLDNDNNFSSSKSRDDSADDHHVRQHETSRNEGSLHLPYRPVASDTTLVDMVDGGGAGLASLSDGYDIEKNHLEAIKREFLRSHCTVDQDFSAMTESAEQNLCMKCNKGGELLACKTTTCPLMVHESCVGGSVQLDTEGKFFCPFCVYSCAISEYLESEKEVFLARKEFAIIMGKGIQN